MAYAPDFSSGEQAATHLAQKFGQSLNLDSSPVLTAKAPKFTRKYSLRELEIQQTIGESKGGLLVWSQS